MMKLSKLIMIALLVGTVAVVGCKDEGGNGGTGGTGGGIDTGCDKGRCLDEAQATKCDEEIQACIAAEPANVTACTVFGNVLFCSEGGTGGMGGEGGTGGTAGSGGMGGEGGTGGTAGSGGMGGEGGTGGAIDVGCDEERCVDDPDQATECEDAILACIALEHANEEECIAFGNLVFCNGDPLVPVFVTSGVTNGNLGGLAGGDSFCTDAANEADLPGDWTAWLSLEATSEECPAADADCTCFEDPSTSCTPLGGECGDADCLLTEEGVDALDRISIGQYVRLDGAPVAKNKFELTNDYPLDAPINVNEDRMQISGDDSVWTGTNSLGFYLGTTTCGRWTDGDEADAAVGAANKDDEAWTDDDSVVDIKCDNERRLYCFADTASN